jgi:hypothetical protein
MHSGSQFHAVLLGAGKVLAPLGLKSVDECERGERAEALVPGIRGLPVFRHLGRRFHKSAHAFTWS